MEVEVLGLEGVGLLQRDVEKEKLYMGGRNGDLLDKDSSMEDDGRWMLTKEMWC
jgi:hypothetical protein